MHGWSEKTVSWKKFSNDSSNEREEDVYVRRIEDSSKKLETRHPSIPRSTRCTIDWFAKAKRVLAPLALLSRRRNFGGPCTLACYPAYSGSIVAQRATLELQRPRRRLPTLLCSPSSFSWGAAHEVHGRETLVQGQAEETHFRDSLTPGSCVDYSPVNWPFSHVNQPRFAPTLRSTFAGHRPRSGADLLFSFLFFLPRFSSIFRSPSIERESSNGIAARPTIYYVLSGVAVFRK